MDDEWRAIAADLIGMAAADAALREELACEGSLFDGYHPRMERLHLQNAARLEAILDAHGWPGRSRVGEQAACAAWVILQHAISNPSLMRRGLEILRAAAESGDASLLEVAMLEDRVRTYEGRQQRYGTHYDWDESGELSPLPIEDEARVDERRAVIGLPSLAEDVHRRRTAMGADRERPPADLAGRRRQHEEWLRRVGWRERLTRT